MRRCVCAVVLGLLGCVARAEEPRGSAYLRTLALDTPAFGWKLEDRFPYDGVRMQRWRRPRPEADWLVVWIDLQTPGLGLAFTEVQPPLPGGIPHQRARGHTILDFAEARPDVQLAINTVAYWPFPAWKGTEVHLSEPVWHDGDTSQEPRPGTLMLGLSPGKGVIGEAKDVRAASPQVAVGSFFDVFVDGPEDSILVRDGKPRARGQKAHARTLAGLREGGRVLILVIVDGYNPGVSQGLSYEDGAEVMRAAGATDAIALDGGGSSALMAREADGTPVVVNRPAGMLNVPGTLRYVGAHLGFTGLRRTEEPLPAFEKWEAGGLMRSYCWLLTWIRVHKAQAAGIGVGVVVLVLAGGVWSRRSRRAASARQGTGGVS